MDIAASGRALIAESRSSVQLGLERSTKDRDCREERIAQQAGEGPVPGGCLGSAAPTGVNFEERGRGSRGVKGGYQQSCEGYAQHGRFPMSKSNDSGARARPGFGRRLERLISPAWTEA
jgi:hypothetical protein